MMFTDTQTNLWSDAEDTKLRARNLPLDELPQEMVARHYVIKFTAITGREFFLWNVSGDTVMWTEQRDGAYRYSDTKYGKMSRDWDVETAQGFLDNVGTAGDLEVVTIF